MKTLQLITFGIILVFLATGNAYSQPRNAPEWVVSEWINGPGVTLEQLRGKVVIVEFFQLWCPGCKQFSIPLMKKWSALFKNEIESGKLAILSIHTVFEGHDYQSPARLREFVNQQNIRHLVGIDKHMKGDKTPETMKRYRTGGTPSIAVIDQEGRIVFQKLGGFNPTTVEQGIRKLLSG